MSRIKGYRRTIVMVALFGLIVAACTADPPAAPQPGDPNPATPAPDQATPTPAISPAPAETETVTPMPAPIDYDYGYGGGGTSSPTASPAAAEAAIGVALNADGAQYLIGRDGLALYVFTQDAAGVSNCSGTCAQNWPPLTVAADGMPEADAAVTGALDVIERGDGSLQVTYDGAPLYYYVGDTAVGDTTGESMGGVWFLARP